MFPRDLGARSEFFLLDHVKKPYRVQLTSSGIVSASQLETVPSGLWGAESTSIENLYHQTIVRLWAPLHQE